MRLFILLYPVWGIVCIKIQNINVKNTVCQQLQLLFAVESLQSVRLCVCLASLVTQQTRKEKKRAECVDGDLQRQSESRKSEAEERVCWCAVHDSLPPSV